MIIVDTIAGKKPVCFPYKTWKLAWKNNDEYNKYYYFNLPVCVLFIVRENSEFTQIENFVACSAADKPRLWLSLLRKLRHLSCGAH